MVFEIFKIHSWQIKEAYNTFPVPEAQKYEKNKTTTTDTQHEHLNTIRRCIN